MPAKSCDMLKRKITQDFDYWVDNGCKKALFVEGARQVGKTTSIREFAKGKFSNFIEINFVKHPKAKEAFAGDLDSASIIMNLSAMGYGLFEKGHTVLFLDEIQECPNARAAVKFLVEDGAVAVIESGSMLGLSFKDSSAIASIPVGYEHHLKMYPLDFEEFLWANKIDGTVISTLKDAYERRVFVPDFIHSRIMDLFGKYLIVGGLPEVVSEFVNSPDFSRVTAAQSDLVAGYRRDIIKYAGRDGTLVNRIFDSIPAQLAKEDKRFVLAELEKGASRRKYDDPTQWLIDSGMAYMAIHVSGISLPLANLSNMGLYKMYLFDTGLVSYMSLRNRQFEVLHGDIGINNGALAENFVAGEMRRKGYELYYFDKKSRHEVDFVLMTSTGASALEVKSGSNFTSHASLNYVLGLYGNVIDEAVVLCKSNVASGDGIWYLPLYMTMFM